MFDSPLKDGLIVLAILLLFFGPKRLPALSRAIGESVREFRGGIAHGGEDKPEVTQAAAQPVAPTAVSSAPAEPAQPVDAQQTGV